MSAPSWMNNTETAAPTTDTKVETTAPATPVTPATPVAAAPNLGDSLEAQAPQTTTPPKEVPKADGEKPKTEEPKADGDKPEAGAYEAFTLPDGYTIADQDLAVFTELGQKYGLPQEGAQSLVNLAVGVVESTRQQIAEESAAEAQQVRDEWKSALLKDPELGGAKLKTTQENLNAFQRSSLANPELLGFLQDSGLITHPSVARLLSQIGASLRETPVGFGADKPRPQRDPASEIFSKSNHAAN